jgi:hypothetical protein
MSDCQRYCMFFWRAVRAAALRARPPARSRAKVAVLTAARSRKKIIAHDLEAMIQVLRPTEFSRVVDPSENFTRSERR